MKDLIKKRIALSEQLAQCSDVVRGSITKVCAKCNRAKCICRKATPRKAYRLTYKNPQQKTCIVYIPQNRMAEIKRMIANHSKLRKILEKLIETNIQIFKTG